jgi:hypothetical protein
MNEDLYSSDANTREVKRHRHMKLIIRAFLGMKCMLILFVTVLIILVQRSVKITMNNPYLIPPI